MCVHIHMYIYTTRTIRRTSDTLQIQSTQSNYRGTGQLGYIYMYLQLFHKEQAYESKTESRIMSEEFSWLYIYFSEKMNCRRDLCILNVHCNVFHIIISKCVYVHCTCKHSCMVAYIIRAGQTMLRS